jgi:hypothetical protein
MGYGYSTTRASARWKAEKMLKDNVFSIHWRHFAFRNLISFDFKCHCVPMNVNDLDEVNEETNMTEEQFDEFNE